MPAQETAYLKQRAVLWSVTGQDEHNEPTFAAPVELCCRWDGVRREATRPDGTPIAITVQVMTNRRVKIGSVLWLGTLAELYDIAGTGSGDFYGQDEELVEVQMYEPVPDLKGRTTQYSLECNKYRDTL